MKRLFNVTFSLQKLWVLMFAASAFVIAGCSSGGDDVTPIPDEPEKPKLSATNHLCYPKPTRQVGPALCYRHWLVVSGHLFVQDLSQPRARGKKVW